MGHTARATSLPTSLDPRRDGHILACPGCPEPAQSGSKEVGRRLSQSRLFFVSTCC
jgi:hypothetical protein